jgi:tripartite-type tricarboxylate transporter receptor subunit TctC
VAAAAAVPALAQPAYPAKAVRFIVGFPPGGTNDIVARVLGAKLSELTGQQFVIDNRGGGGGLIGMEISARAAADGYTLLFTSASYVAAMATRKRSYETLRTMAPVVEVAAAPYVVAVHPSLPASLRGVLDLARAKPGQLAYASTGAGGLTHLATELLASLTKVSFTHVPYKGAGPALPDLLAGRTAMIITPAIALMTHFQSGKLRALAVTGDKPLPELPQVPTAAETVPGYIVVTWYAFLAPGGTPRPIVDRLNLAINRILGEAEMKRIFDAQGIAGTGGSTERLGKVVRTDYERWAKVVKDNDIKVD